MAFVTVLLFILPFLMLTFGIFLLIENWKFHYKAVYKVAAYISVVPILLIFASIYLPLQLQRPAESLSPQGVPAGIYVDRITKDTIKVKGRAFSYHYATSPIDNFTTPSISLTEYKIAKPKVKFSELLNVYNRTPPQENINDYYTLSIYGAITYPNKPADNKPASGKKKKSTPSQRPICRKYKVTFENGNTILSPFEMPGISRFV